MTFSLCSASLRFAPRRFAMATALLTLASSTAYAANSPPTVEDPGLRTDEDTPLEVTLKANDLDRDKLEWRLAKPAKSGAASLEADGTLRYTPKDDFNGKDEILVEVTDGKAKSSKKLAITVSSVNDPPSGAAAPLRGVEDKRVSGQIVAKDPDKDPLIFTIQAQPPAGEAKVDGSGKIDFNPAPNQSGTFTFEVRMTDGSVDITVPVTVVLEPVNDPPTLKGQNLQTKEDVPLKGALTAEDPDREPLQWSLTDKPAHGTLDLDVAKGAFLYTPAKEYAGEDAFSLTVSDGKQSAKARVEVTVQNVNDPPTISALSLEGDEDTPIKGKVVAKDFDGDVVYFNTKVEPKNGEAEIDHEDGTLVYTPKANFFGTDTIVVEASDIAGGVTTPVKITVKPVNDAPEARADRSRGDEDQPIAGKLVATDVDKDALTFSLVKGPKTGTVDLKADGAFRFTPAAHVHGEDAFELEVTDGKAKTRVTHELVVKPVNDAPTAADVALETQEDKPVRGKLVATDIDKDALSYALGKSAKKGAVEVDDRTGSFQYTPNLNENGEDAFTIVASDGPAQAEANVRVKIAPVNDAPVAQALEKSGEEDHVVQGDVVAADLDGDALTYAVIAKPRAGTVELDARTGAWRYTPNAQANGADAFRVEVSDGKLRASADVKLTIAAVNDAPEPKPLALATSEEKPVTGAVSASDIDKDKLTYALALPAKKGTATVDASSGRVSYAPNLNENGDDSFSVEVSDGTTKTPLTVTVAIAPVNDAPVASAHEKGGNEDEPITGALIGSDVDKDALTYKAITSPRLGAVVVDPNSGSYTYTPRAHANGEDGFKLEVSDGKLRATAEVKLIVAAVNDAPEPKELALKTQEDKAVSGAVSASDIDKDALTWTIAKPAQKGVAVVDAKTGKLTYAPNKDENGVDTFTVSVSDGAAFTPAQVTVTLEAVNDAPVADAGSAAGLEDATITGKLVARDVDKDTLMYHLIGAPRLGTVEVNASTGGYSYAPNKDANGEDTFGFEVSDGKVRAAAEVKLVLTPVNDAPVPVEASVTTNEDKEASGKVAASDVDKDVLTFRVKEPPARGVAFVDDATGAFRYAPRRDLHGKDSFVVEVTDGLASAVAKVNVDVAATPDAPVVDVRPIETAEDAAVSAKLTALDADADAVSFKVLTQPRLATAEIEADGKTLRLTPKPDQHGEDVVVLEASDGPHRVKASVPVLIAAKNDAPTLDAVAAETPEETAVVLGLVAHDKDGDAVKLALDDKSVKAAPAVVTLTGHLLRVVPRLDFAGAITVDVVPSDATAKGAPLQVTITVTNVNDAPVAKDLAITAAPGASHKGAVEASDVDAGDELSFSIAVPPRQGTAALEDPRAGRFSYTAGDGARGEDSFRIRVKDKAGASVTATVRVTIKGAPAKS